jgi:hypothetical protein
VKPQCPLRERLYAGEKRGLVFPPTSRNPTATNTKNLERPHPKHLTLNPHLNPKPSTTQPHLLTFHAFLNVSNSLLSNIDGQTNSWNRLSAASDADIRLEEMLAKELEKKTELA